MYFRKIVLVLRVPCVKVSLKVSLIVCTGVIGVAFVQTCSPYFYEFCEFKDDYFDILHSL